MVRDLLDEIDSLRLGNLVVSRTVLVEGVGKNGPVLLRNVQPIVRAKLKRGRIIESSALKATRSKAVALRACRNG